MNLLSDVITYIRRLIKTPSDASITDNLLIDYINRFWIMDVDARLQLFDLKTKYAFQTVPGVDQYNMPLYTTQTQPGGQIIAPFPVYQGFLGPAYVNGVEVSFQTQQKQFFKTFPNVVQSFPALTQGNGTAGPYTINIPILPNIPSPTNPPLQGLLRGHIDITGIIALSNLSPTYVFTDPPVVTSSVAVGTGTTIGTIAQVPTTSVFPGIYITSIDSTGASVVVSDSGQFLAGNVNYGLLMQPGQAPNGNTPLPATGGNPAYSITSNTVNYFTGVINVTFNTAIPVGQNISVQCNYFATGLPRMILYYNNTLTLRSPPAYQYLVELDAYLTPAAFLSTSQAIPFGYMAEYIARGAARKILSDTGDWDQFDRYEPLFIEQEILVWKRSQRQWTSTRTQTIYSQSPNQTGVGYNNFGGASL